MAGSRTPDSKAVRRAVESGDWPPVWLWTGPEDFLKRELFRALSQAVDPTGLNVTRYRAGESELEPILVNCRTMPMLAERRLVELTHIEALRKGERDLLNAYAAAPAPETVLVLSTQRGPRDALAAKLQKAGAAGAVFWTPFAKDTIKWIQLRLQGMGKTCPPAVAEALFQACGFGDQVALSEIAPEIEKVASAVGDKDYVTEDDLIVIGYKPGSDRVQALIDCVGRNDAAGALLALHDALQFKENDPVRLVALLALRLQTVSQVQALLESGAPPAEVPRQAGIWPREWPKVERSSRSLPQETVRRCLSVLAQADRSLKSSPEEPRLVLERTIMNICSG